MNMTPEEYQQYVQKRQPRSPVIKDTALAFLVGGAICVLGQLIQNGWLAAGLEKQDAGTAASCTLVFLSALLTGLNLYNKIARFGGFLGLTFARKFDILLVSSCLPMAVRELDPFRTG